MRKLILASLACLALAALTAIPAGARPTRPNGQIAFNRYDEPNTVIETVNPDGTNEQQVIPHPALSLPLECPTWSPDGTRIATCGAAAGSTYIINPDNGTYRELPFPDPALFTPCSVWSPDAKRLACGSFGQTDPSRNGIYTIRTSDGGGLTRVTANPGGDDEPGDYSPGGRRLVFARFDPNGDPVGLFIVNVNGTGLKRITPTGTLISSDSFGDWSPQRNEILFSRHLTRDVHSTIWIVHSDGTGLHEIHVQGTACGGPNDDPNAVACADPRWSPDGTKLVFVLSSAAGTNIYTVNADGTGLTQVSHGGTDHFPDWGTHPLAG
jgi:Tol biopolymer transport system component